MKRSDEAKERMRLAKLGKPRKPFTDEWKQKMKEAQKARRIKERADRVRKLQEKL